MCQIKSIEKDTFLSFLLKEIDYQWIFESSFSTASREGSVAMRVKGHPFFKRVDEMLERRGKYRKEIAPLMGCSENNISAMFTRGTLPDIERCYALAAFLQCSPRWLAWNEGHWEEPTAQDTELVSAMKAVPEAPRGPLLELAAYLSKIPPAVKVEKTQLSFGLPNRLTLLERAIDSLQLIQASMSPRDPLALLAESQELALWRQYESLKKPQPAAAPESPKVSEHDSSTAAPARGRPAKAPQLVPVH